MFCLKIATLVIQFKWFITKLTHFILFFVSFWIALQKTWYYQKIVKGTRIKLQAHLSNKALIKFHSVLWYLKFVHATFQVCLYGLSVWKIEVLSNTRGVYLCLIFEMSIWEFITKLDFFSSSNLIFTACVACKNQFRNQIDFLIF